jgi:ABC-2 type transport system permease protein
MRVVALLLAKDARAVARSPLLLAALVVYPLLIALLVGLLVRYAGERPRVALVDEAGLPRSILLGERRFDLKRLFEEAAEVDLVRMTNADAASALDRGRVLAVVTVPKDFTVRLRRLRESPSLTLRTTEDALGTRVVEKMHALVYAINLKLQKAYIEANLGYVDLLRKGGTARIGDERLTVIGLTRARKQLEQLAKHPDPAVARPAGDLARFVKDVEGAIGQVGEFLRATANPITLEIASREGRTWLVSAQVQAYSLVLSLAFVSVLLGAATITAERTERTMGRLVRGLVRLGELVIEKVILVSAIGTVLALALAVVFGVIVELGDVSGGEPWPRLALLAPGLALAAAAFGAFGVLLGTLVRDASAAMLVGLLIALPATIVGLLPRGSVFVADWAANVVPFRHAIDYAQAALYDPDPGTTVWQQGLWLLGLTAGFAFAARLCVRRLLL